MTIFNSYKTLILILNSTFKTPYIGANGIRPHTHVVPLSKSCSCKTRKNFRNKKRRNTKAENVISISDFFWYIIPIRKTRQPSDRSRIKKLILRNMRIPNSNNSISTRAFVVNATSSPYSPTNTILIRIQTAI